MKGKFPFHVLFGAVKKNFLYTNTVNHFCVAMRNYSESSSTTILRHVRGSIYFIKTHVIIYKLILYFVRVRIIHVYEYLIITLQKN